MVRLSKQSRKRAVSFKRPKIKTAAAKRSCGSCGCKKKKMQHVRTHENALEGVLAQTIFIPKN